jgi:hypothetical protein
MLVFLARIETCEAQKSQLAYFTESLERNLALLGIKIVNLEGQKYNAGMAVKILNIEDFSADGEFIVE